MQRSSTNVNQFIREACKFLIDFTYTEIKKKRTLAIQDMRNACFEASEKSPAEFKDYIDLYFNSKYARTGYSFENDQGIIIEASLKDRYLDENNSPKEIEDSAWIQEFIKITRIDPKAGEIDNIKHLRGACIRIKSNLSQSNSGYVISILQAYCLFMLEFKNRRLLDDAFDLLREGFETMENLKYSDAKMRIIYDQFINDLLEHNTELQSYLDKFDFSFDFSLMLISRYLNPMKKGVTLLGMLNKKLKQNG